MALVAPDRRFLSVNRRFAEMFAVDPAEILGTLSGSHRERVERVFAEPERFLRLVAGTADDQNREFSEVFEQCWPQRRDLQLVSTPVRSEDGQFLGRLYVFRDVTNEREVDRMKTQFVSMVSHELRTPLTSIKGFIDLILEGEVGDVPNEQAEFLQIVRNNADRLVSLVNDLLDVSRIDSGKIHLQPAPVALDPLIREVSESLRSHLREKGHTLSLDLPDALPPVLADRDRLVQILGNLLSNANRYTPPGGTIVVRAAANVRQVRIEVEDTGIGLSPEEQQQVFSRFFRARNRATQEAGGTGLGLAITRALVELHGGTIEVQSTPGQGSTFSFTLPMQHELLV
jgi:signal transduction histidine kinase